MRGVKQEGEGGKGKGSSFKADREASRKAEAGKRASWNTLYMRPDTVVQAAAALLGTTAAALLDPDSEGVTWPPLREAVRHTSYSDVGSKAVCHTSYSDLGWVNADKNLF